MVSLWIAFGFLPKRAQTYLSCLFSCSRGGPKNSHQIPHCKRNPLKSSNTLWGGLGQCSRMFQAVGDTIWAHLFFACAQWRPNLSKIDKAPIFFCCSGNPMCFLRLQSGFSELDGVRPKNNVLQVPQPGWPGGWGDFQKSPA